MYFYVDESGNTGLDIFNKEQPFLFYGVVSCNNDLDIMLYDKFTQMRSKCGVSRLHAAELGNTGLLKIIDDIEEVIELGINFDLHFIVKEYYAITCFFDQVFDQGMNPAVPWLYYWTELRYLLLLHVGCLFDRELIEKAWATRIETNNKKATIMLAEICNVLIPRINIFPDPRAREIIYDSLRWAAENAEKIEYNVRSKTAKLEISPNLIGFQFVMTGIAERLQDANRTCTSIIVDIQSEFNKTQKALAETYAEFGAKSIKFLLPDIEFDFSIMPTTPIKCMSGKNSLGLELVDLLLWICTRLFNDKKLDDRLSRLAIRLIENENIKMSHLSENGILDRFLLNEALWPEYSDRLRDQYKPVKDKSESERKKHTYWNHD